MNEFGFVTLGVILAASLLGGASAAFEGSNSQKMNKYEALLLIDFLHSNEKQVGSGQKSGCLKSRGRELGETWCVNCHAGTDPDRVGR